MKASMCLTIGWKTIEIQKFNNGSILFIFIKNFLQKDQAFGRFIVWPKAWSFY